MPVCKIVSINVLADDDTDHADLADMIKFAIHCSSNCTQSFSVEEIRVVDESEQPTIDGFVEYLDEYISEEINRGASLSDACSKDVFEVAANAYRSGER